MEAVAVALEVIYDGGGPTRVVVSGELDLESAGWFGRSIDSELDAAHDVIVDLSHARMGDSTPLEALARAQTRASENGWRLEVRPRSSLMAG